MRADPQRPAATPASAPPRPRLLNTPTSEAGKTATTAREAHISGKQKQTMFRGKGIPHGPKAPAGGKPRREARSSKAPVRAAAARRGEGAVTADAPEAAPGRARAVLRLRRRTLPPTHARPQAPRRSQAQKGRWARSRAPETGGRNPPRPGSASPRARTALSTEQPRILAFLRSRFAGPERTRPQDARAPDPRPHGSLPAPPNRLTRRDP